jgi:hypothetical protein
MSVTSGFFNSINHDRRYNAIQLSSIFDGIIKDGVFATVGDAFKVTAVGGNRVSVGIGRAWFNHIWVYNDSPLFLELDAPEVLLNRRDAIVIEINNTESVRKGDIKVVKGTPSSSSTPPVPNFVHNEQVNQYPIALITRTAEASEITQSKISYCVGSAALTPFVTGVLQTISIDTIVAQWQAEWNEWQTQQQAEFDTWFDGLQEVLSENAEVELANKINETNALLNSLSVRKTTFRGNRLGSSLSALQYARIQNGTFEDMYIGDYWEGTDGVIWRIVDFDYWLGTGDTEFTKHHVVIMPDSPIFTSTMATEQNTSTGYAGCEARVNRENTWKVPCVSMFSGHVLTHREYFTTAVNASGYPSGGAWYDSDVDLPNEIMMYGCHVFAPASDGSIDVARYTVSKSQLALFRVCPQYITGRTDGVRKDCWLRDVANIKRFAFVSKNGEASYGTTTSSKGFRPAFAIG